MPLTGKQKAALLLTTLDAVTAAELLKGVDTGTVQELAVELSYLDAAGFRDAKQTTEVARQFCKSLRQEPDFHFKSFLRDILRNSVGEDQAKQIQQEIADLLQKRDPFLPLRSADLQTLAAVLETEHPQAVAVVLSELPPKRGSELLGLLNEGVRVSAVSRMTSLGATSPEAKARIAQLIQGRLAKGGGWIRDGRLQRHSAIRDPHLRFGERVRRHDRSHQVDRLHRGHGITLPGSIRPSCSVPARR